MSDQRNGGIAWTDESWNPVRGCSRVSEGCRNCYAEVVAGRFCGPGLPYEGLAIRKKSGSQWTGEVRMVPEHFADPLRWTRPRRVFVNSMSDIFHEKLTNREIAAVFGIMAAAPHHTFQVLTKRPKRMREWFDWISSISGRDAAGNGVRMPVNAIMSCAAHANDIATSPKDKDAILRAYNGSMSTVWPLPNVWLGVSTEDQETANERIPLLLQTPAAVRFISAEPLLGPIDLCHVVHDATGRNALRVNSPAMGLQPAERHLDWVIIGGESGPRARICNVRWMSSIVEQCLQADVAVFVKQLGSQPSVVDPIGILGEKTSLDTRWPITDSKGGILKEFPSDLRVRQFPEMGEPVREGGKDFTGCDV
jgi:protein gp37